MNAPENRRRQGGVKFLLDENFPLALSHYPAQHPAWGQTPNLVGRLKR